MTQTNWFNPLAKITPFIFNIKTPTGSGTGFQISFSERNGFCGVATANHVVSHEDEWDEPIRIIHHKSGKSILLKSNDRVIFRYPDKDLAFILFYKKDLPIEPKPLLLIDKGKILKQGVEVGWCGFPAVAINELCFFAGYISCPIPKEDSYLVDGVAINGVSGGPVFYIDSSTSEPKYSGLISRYIANRVTGETLPGLCVVRSVEQYQDTLQKLKDLEEAKQKEEEEKKKQEEAILEEVKQKEEEKKKKQAKKKPAKKRKNKK